MWLQGFFSSVCSALSLKLVGVLTLTQWKKAQSLIISWTDSILQKFSIQLVFITSPSIVIDTLLDFISTVLVFYILTRRLISDYYKEKYGGYYG